MRLQATVLVLPVKRFLLRSLQTRPLCIQELRRTSQERSTSSLRMEPLLRGRRSTLQRHVLSSQNYRRPVRAQRDIRCKRDDFPIGMCSSERCALRDNNTRFQRKVSTRQSQKYVWNLQKSMNISKSSNNPVSCRYFHCLLYMIACTSQYHILQFRFIISSTY